MYETRRVQHQITGGFITVVASGHNIPAFWAHPEVGGSFPGLVLIHDWWGLLAHTRTLARRYAELGFYVIAPDLFDGQTAQTSEQATVLQARLADAGIARVNASLRALETHHRCNGKMAVVGMGMGGRLAIHAALHRTDLRAAVEFDGQAADMLALLPACRTPLLGFYGVRDNAAAKAMIAKLRDGLAKSTAACKIVEYPTATPGFHDETRPTYDADCAMNAWEQAVDFLCARLDLDLAAPAPQQTI